MARTESSFWRSQVWGRRKQLLVDSDPWVSLGLAIVSMGLIPHIPLAGVKIEDVAQLGFIYAALSFGAAITGAGLTFGIPGKDRIRRWSLIKAEGSRFSSFSNLIFVFAWAASIQLGVVIVSVLAVAFGSGYEVLPSGAIPSHVIFLFLSVWVWWYALLELAAVIQTILQVANAIIGEESRNQETTDNIQ